MDELDRLLELSPEQLRRWHSRRRGRGRYRRRRRPKRSKEQLADYLRLKGFRTRAQLRAGRREGDPTDDDYREAYGSWGDAVREIWRKELPTKRYMVNAVVQSGLWSKAAYQEARSERPELYPSMRIVRREFGSWSILKEIATAMSFRKTLAAYMDLKRRLGRRPTKEDCRVAGVIIDRAVKVYGSKSGLDRFVESLEEMK